MSSMTQTSSPPEQKLGPADGYTVPCDMTPFVDHSRLSENDIALVVYYRPWPFTLFQSYKLFRFAGHPSSDLNYTIYEQQPSSDLGRVNTNAAPGRDCSRRRGEEVRVWAHAHDFFAGAV
jgi:hypothetical protein